MRKVILWLFLVSLCVSGLCAADYPSRDEFLKLSYSGSGGTMPYRMFLPKNTDPNAKYPLVVFLHGSGEAGSDNESQLDKNGNGSLWLVNTDYQQTHPLYFCAPQANSWGASSAIQNLRELIDKLLEDYPGIDPDRVIVTGISNGGTGTYNMMANHSDILAGAVPMQGGSNWKKIATHPNLNIWHFHAENDNSGYFPIATADYCIKYLRSNGLKVSYTRYHTGGHGIWPVAYRTPRLIDWIYNVRRGVVYEGSPFIKVQTNNGEDFTTNQSKVALSGISGDDDLAVTEVKYFNTRTTSWTATCNGTTQWSVADIPLRSGSNKILNIAYGTSWSAKYGGYTSVNDTVYVTYDPNYVPGEPNAVPVIESLYADPEEITLPQNTVNLSALATDEDDDPLTYSWSKASGAGEVTFEPATGADSLATFAAAGTYEISVTVRDGKDVTSQNVTVVVLPEAGSENTAPVITSLTASASNITLPVDSVVLTAVATDSEEDALSYAWSLISGPTAVTFSDGVASCTDVTFTQSGTYVLALTVSDGQLTTEQTVSVTVSPAPVTQLTNVALNKPAVGDSYLDEAKYPASKAVDGDSSSSASRWLSADNGQEHSLVVDLQGDFEISSIKMWSGYMQHGFAIANYDFQILSGDEWVSVVTVRDNTEQFKEHSFTACVTSKVRLLCGSEDLARLYELEVYGITAPEVAQDPENVVLNKPATGDTYYDEAKYPASDAVDGDTSDVNSRWLSLNNGENHYIEIDLQGSYTVNQASLWMGYKTAGYAIKDYQLQVWDGSEWQSVVTVTDNAEQHKEHEFTPVTTTKIRLYCGSDDLARLYEIQVMGVPAD